MNQMPSFEVLRASIGHTYRLLAGDEAAVDVELTNADAGVAMDDRHICYSAMFRLPPGMTATQGTYRIVHPQGMAWDLFLSPNGPDKSGRQRLGAIIHCRADADTSG